MLDPAWAAQLVRVAPEIPGTAKRAEPGQASSCWSLFHHVSGASRRPFRSSRHSGCANAT